MNVCVRTHRMCVDRNYSNRSFPFVVNLVNVFVNVLRVHKAVKSIKCNIKQSVADQQGDYQPRKAGNGPNVLFTQVRTCCVETSAAEQNRDRNLIEENCKECFEKLSCVWRFIRARLNFVFSEPSGEVKN